MSNNDLAILILGIICAIDTVILAKHEMDKASMNQKIRRTKNVSSGKRQ